MALNNTFLQNIQEVTGSKVFFSVIGIILWILTLLTYIMLHDRIDSAEEGSIIFAREDGYLSDLSLAIIIIHCIVLAFVGIDTIFYNFFVENNVQVYFQAGLVIAPGSFNTFVLGGMVAAAAVIDLGDQVFESALAALIMACLSNSLMIALLFAIFHSKQNINETFNVRVGARPGGSNTLSF